MRLPLGSLGGEAVLLSDGNYVSFASRTFGDSKSRILASVFIIDPRVGDAPEPHVFNLLIACQLAWDLCRALGLDARWLTAMDTRGSHMKLVVADDTVIVGSHNWSAGAFDGQSQESVAIRSPSLAAVCARTFENQWNRTEHAPRS